ncbi:hypothetical protein VTL71DRAFT_13884 [Oculimacula yallundae]|uniref:AA9 family lytic polysaccharide monooxygenase n=1 Tax=Oculimacula yallundae TaxID=86028 RepID=A0ABR4CLN8_9HELO
MKLSLIVAAAAAQVASAHYFFDTNIINGQTTKNNQYIRKFTRKTWYNPIKFSNNPEKDIRDGSFIDGPDARCNQGGGASGTTETLTIAAGSKVTFKLGVGATMAHPGPALVYMSKAAGSVKEADGSGDWFKIFQSGVCNKSGDFTSTAWCTWDKNTIEATIPAGTPAGEYLVRVEHIGVHRSHVNQPEHFVSCMQVKVTGSGTGTPGPLVKFPGAYKSTDPYANFSVYNGFKDFPFPGPAVWTGGASGAPAAAAAPAVAATTMKTSTTKAAAAATPAAPAAGGAPLYGQCS